MKRLFAFVLLAASCHAQLLPIIGSKGVPSTQLASPTASPVAGNYATTQTVTLSGPAGATICYQTTGPITVITPGTCPAGSTTYTTGITVSASETIYAVATQGGYITSAGSSFVYVILATLATGSVTNANFHVSTINGTAFVDFSASSTLCPYIGDKLTVTDSTSHTIVGWILSCSSGETLGSELLANTTFNDTTGLTAANSTLSSVTTGDCSSTPPSGHCLQVLATAGFGNAFEGSSQSTGVLLKASEYYEKGTETTLAYVTLQRSGVGALAQVTGTPSTLTLVTLYGTTPASGTYGIQSQTFTNGKYALFATASMKQVLTPTANGVVIASAQYGSTQNWASVNASFTFNNAGNYTYAITTY